MNDKHVRAMIALPLRECTPSQLRYVELHMQECNECRRGVEASAELDEALGQLDDPAPPDNLTASIMFQITSFSEKPAPALQPSQINRDRSAWTAASIGIVVGLGAQLYGLFVGELPLSLISQQVEGGIGGVIDIPAASATILVLAMGVLLYVTGIFALVRRD